MGSLARASRDADVDAPRRHLGVFLVAHEVELGRPDIGVPGELAHLGLAGGLPGEWSSDAPSELRQQLASTFGRFTVDHLGVGPNGIKSPQSEQPQ